jgi:tetratricopeptide (TPR) repeat protein
MSSIHEALRQSGRTSGTPSQTPPTKRRASKQKRWPYILVLTVMVVVTFAALVWFFGLVFNILHPGGGFKAIIEDKKARAELEALKDAGPPEPVNVVIMTSPPGRITPVTPKPLPPEETRSNELPTGPLPSVSVWPEPGATAETEPSRIPEPPSAPTMEEPVPEQPGASDYFQEARLAHDRGDTDLAVHLYRRALDADPNLAAALFNLGNIYLFDRKQPELALEMFEQVLTLEPDNKMAYNNLGVLYMRDGRLEEAEKFLSAALEKDPAFVDAVYNLACLNARQGRYSLAMSYLRKAGRLTPDAAVWARDDEDLKSLRDRPEFKRFLDETPEPADARKDNIDG